MDLPKVRLLDASNKNQNQVCLGLISSYSPPESLILTRGSKCRKEKVALEWCESHTRGHGKTTVQGQNLFGALGTQPCLLVKTFMLTSDFMYILGSFLVSQNFIGRFQTIRLYLLQWPCQRQTFYFQLLQMGHDI